MRTGRRRIAITIGDPAGIGPEIVAKALSRDVTTEVAEPVVIGDLGALERARELTAATVTFRRRAIGDGLSAGSGIDVYDADAIDLGALIRAKPSELGGRAAHAYLATATHLALKGEVDGIVTAPVNKEALALAGWPEVGHTELLADMCGVDRRDVAMMLASDRLRVVHVSTHVSLRRAVQLVRTGRIVRTAVLAATTTAEIIGRPPRIGIAGLNPHAGEHGLFGSEEEDEILPAVERLRAKGLDVVGPIAPDTIFMRALDGQFDAVVAMYHDQGHIPSKLAGLSETVNVTLGLPIIRTSVDHGTAFDIAGTGVADDTNLVMAYRLAARMADNKASAEV